MLSYIILSSIITLLLFSIFLCHRYIKQTSDTMLYNILEQTRTYGILIDKNNKINRVSNAMCELLEVQHFELLGKHISCVFNEEDRRQINSLLKNIDNNRLEIIDHLTIKGKTKKSHVLCKLTKVEGTLNFHHKILLFQDRTNIINSIKKIENSEKTLKEYSNLFRSSFDDSFLPSVIITSEGVITNYNKSFHSLLKKDIETNNVSIFELLGIEKNSFLNSTNLNKCFETSCKINNLNKDLVFNTHKISDSSNNGYILCQIQDITKQKQAEQIRKQLEEKILKTRKLEYLGELSGMISHEFNNALMPILSFSKSVEKSLPDDMIEQKDKLQKVIQASNHAKKMVSQIMEIKHIDFHKPEKVNLNKLIEANIPNLDVPTSIKINIDNNLESPETIANFEVLSKAMQNVVKNSFQALGEKGGDINMIITEVSYDNLNNIPKSINQSHISTKKTYFSFEINDTATTFNKEDFDKVFNPFFTTNHFNKQIGTGLTYVYNCMEKFNIPFVMKLTPAGGVSLIAYFPKA